MVPHTILGHLLILCSWTSVVAIRIYGYTTTRSEYTGNLDIFRIHKLYKVLHYYVHAILVEISMVSEAEEIQFQTLAFHHPYVRQIADTYLSKVRLACNRTKACKLRAIETHPIVILRMLVLERLQYLRSIVLTIYCAATQKGQFIFSIHFYKNNLIRLVSHVNDTSVSRS